MTMPTLFSVTTWISLLAVSTMETPIWLQAIRELGSFGLVAFLVWHYTTKVAPENEKKFIDALADSRKDYLAAQKEQRLDYINTRSEDRLEQRKLSEAITDLAKRIDKV